MAGVYSSSKVLNALLILKIILMLVLVSTLFKNDVVEPTSYSSNKILSDENTSYIKMFLVSLIPVCFTYGGYQQTINFGSEYAKTKFFTKGIIVGITIVIVFYLLLNIAYCHAFGFEKLKNAQAIGASLFQIWFGTLGSKIFDLLVVFSVMAYSNVLLMSNPRVMYAMAEDGLLPSIFLKKHSKTNALVIGLIVFYTISILILLIGKSIDKIMDFTMFLDSIGMIASVATIFFIAKKYKEILFSSTTKLLAFLFIVFYMLVVTGVIIQDYKSALVGIALLLFFMLIGYFTNKK